MRQYLDSLERIITDGNDREGRNGHTRSLWVEQLRFDLREGFPVVTTKKMLIASIVAELLWFLQGPTCEGRMDDNELKKFTGKARTIWTANAVADYWQPHALFPGDLGRIYGAQWRDWRLPDGGSLDQLGWAVSELRENPNNRRIVVTAYNPGELKDMALPPCHMMFHFYSSNNVLAMHMLQRSADMFLGVPYNITSYALLLAMTAQVTGMIAGELVITFEDAHIYHQHFDVVRTQLDRNPRSLPSLRLNPDVKDIDGFTMDDIRLENYRCHPAIKAQMIV